MTERHLLHLRHLWQLRLVWAPCLVAAVVGSTGLAQTAEQPSVPISQAASGALRSYAVEIMTGPAWDASKPPQAQAFFSEHSAHLRELRRAGHITAGVRYGSRGLLFINAVSVDAVRALLKPDPSLAHGTFVADVQPMLVFYPGALSAPAAPRPAASAP
jgi:hypothetical protein